MDFMRWYRRPRTKQAKQVASGDAADGLQPRGKRSAINLPDSWDDKPVAVRYDKSWKRLRKLPWKRIAEA